MRSHVLISGAGVAGPALAHLLAAAGSTVTVVERFDGLRDTGHNVDIRGAAREVVRRMGLDEAVKAATTGETGTAFVDERGDVVAAFPAGRSDTDGATAEVEILRGELARLLYERTRNDVEYVFGDRITGLDDRPDGVTVTFDRSPERTFDLVVVADGFRSRTRDLAFPGARTTDLGLYMAYVTIPRTPADDDRWRWYNALRARQISLRPDNVGTIRAYLAFLSDVRGLDELDAGDQALILRETFRDAGWVAERVLNGLGEPFYFESIGQVRLPRWSSGHVALLGDAAWCASPLSGMGTSLALVGAYVLAGELTTRDDHRDAFARFEATMRPYVERAQKLPPGTPRLAFPRTRTEVTLLRTALRIAASPPARRAGGLFSPPADEIALPHYASFRPAAHS
jgi:2-polyprenyl-6-methoxyphenol hydroxylase-like FAD-dependent oxidoreductase